VNETVLYWKPNWQPTPMDEFRRRVDEATSASGWVLAGSYSKQWDISWGRAEAIVWLDIGLPLIVARILRRSYQRWRSGELLWGTNRERLLPQLKVWDERTSLVAWAVRHHATKRRDYEAAMRDERWRHLRFHRFRSNDEAEQWTKTLGTFNQMERANTHEAAKTPSRSTLA
jgi:adenylate kinase family enzyme